jgi:hypothetical protein
VRAVLQGCAHLRAVGDSSLALCRPRGSISEAKATRRPAHVIRGAPCSRQGRPRRAASTSRCVRVALRPRRAASTSRCVRVALRPQEQSTCERATWLSAAIANGGSVQATLKAMQPVKPASSLSGLGQTTQHRKRPQPGSPRSSESARRAPLRTGLRGGCSSGLFLYHIDAELLSLGGGDRKSGRNRSRGAGREEPAGPFGIRVAGR